MTRPTELGIVGGGASAVCLLDALAQADAAPGGITIFEPGSALWRGRPFQDDIDAVLVNAPPREMSVRFGDDDHFESWLTARDAVLGADGRGDDPWSGPRFVPRGMYGEYLEQSARAALARLLERGWRILVAREQVVAATPQPGGVELVTEVDRRHSVDHAVLCVGVGRAADTYGLAGSPGFVGDLYPVSRALDEVDPDGEVGVIGSGLTAVDAVLALAARGHRGRITMLSRRGVLPAVRQRPISYTLRHFTATRFREIAAEGGHVTLPWLVELMRDELDAAGEDVGDVVSEIEACDREDPVLRLRRQLAAIDAPSRALRIVQRAVPDTGPDVWPLLADQDRRLLLRSHYRAVMSLCCPMPPGSAAVLLGLVDEGRLRIVSRVGAVGARSGGGFLVATGGEEFPVDTVINAASVPAHKIPPMAANLVASLVSTGAAEPHPYGGLSVDRRTSRLVVGGGVNAALYALGDLAAGSLFFTFGIPSLVDRAYDIARTILARDGDSDLARSSDTLQVV